MAQMAPPSPPWSLPFADGDGRSRSRFRIWQITASSLTILVTGWLVSLGPVPAVLALLAAKHILVAILVMGVGLDAAPDE
jgi:hypothetical protein